MIVRRDELRASKAMQKRVFNTRNIEILWKHQTKEVLGDQGVTGVELYKNKGEAGEEMMASFWPSGILPTRRFSRITWILMRWAMCRPYPDQPKPMCRGFSPAAICRTTLTDRL